MLQRPYHPWLLALWPCLALWASNARRTGWQELLLPALLALALAGSLVLLGRGVARDRWRGGLLASLGVLVFWWATPLLRLLERSLPDPTWVRAEALLIAGLLLLLAVGVARIKRDLAPLSNALDLATLVVVLSALGPGLWSALRPAQAAQTAIAELPPTIPLAPQERSASDLPDILYIVLDAFGREDVLRDIYGMEGGLAQDLESMGFVVAQQSQSNYDTTIHSLSSALSLNYLSEVLPPDMVGRDQEPLVRRICNSVLLRSLAPLGYRFISFDSGHYITRCHGADELIRPRHPLSELQLALIDHSPVALLPASLRQPLSPYRAHRRRVLEAFERLPEVAVSPSPKLVFVHVVSPHNPFVFGPDGEDVSPYGHPFSFNSGGTAGKQMGKGQRSAEYVARYRDQARYIGRRTVSALRLYLERATRPTVIIVQGDHGPNSTWPWPEPEERYPILNAFYLPGPDGELPYPAMSPVNNFRLILRRYFGARLEYLPDQRYRTSYWQPYEFRGMPEDPGAPLGAEGPSPAAAALGAQPGT